MALQFSSPLGIVLGALRLLQHGPLRVDAFVLPASISSTRPSVGSKSSLAYGLRDDGDEEQDLTAPSASSSFSSNAFQEQLNDLNPNCDIDDEDCLAFSSLDDQPLVFSSNANEDPLCDPQDVDCQAFLPKTYLNSDTYLATELRTRSDSIERERVGHNWRTAHCPTSFVSVSSSDWVRRVHMESYPIAVCGGARGGVHVVNLEEKTVVAKVEGAHTVQVEQGGAAMAKQAMEKLYGKLDGGGVVAVAIHGDLIATSGREGGVRLWRLQSFENLPPIKDPFAENTTFYGLDRTKGRLSKMPGKMAKSTDKEQGSETKNNGPVLGGQLIPLGSIRGLQNTIVTSLKFDSNGLLWTACYDGTVDAFAMNGYDDSSVRFPPPKPLFSTDFTDSVLDMDLSEELKLGVCATADGSAALFNMDNGQFFCGIMLFEGVAARSVLIVKHKGGAGYSVLCGGTDGTIHRIELNIDPSTGRVDQENPFHCNEATQTAIKPRHVGPVMCMASPDDGMFVSGGQDGALRVWDCPEEAESGPDGKGKQQTGQQTLLTKCMYALTGYKLWLGSACTDGKRLVSDGGENSVIVRDFSREPGTKGKASL